MRVSAPLGAGLRADAPPFRKFLPIPAIARQANLNDNTPAEFRTIFGGRKHFLPSLPYGDGRGRRFLQPLRRAPAREMPSLRRAQPARKRVLLLVRQSDSRLAAANVRLRTFAERERNAANLRAI